MNSSHQMLGQLLLNVFITTHMYVLVCCCYCWCFGVVIGANVHERGIKDEVENLVELKRCVTRTHWDLPYQSSLGHVIANEPRRLHYVHHLYTCCLNLCLIISIYLK